MKNQLLTACSVLIALAALLACFATSSLAAEPLRIDVLYMNHGPMMPTLEEMRETFARYEDKLQVNWHDFESQEGEVFMTKKGVKSHVPLQIWLDGKDTLAVGGKEVRFVGFPTGSGPAFFQGKWSMNDLEEAIKTLTAGHRGGS